MEWISVILLIVIGIALIIAEVILIPGTTVVGILGFSSTIGGIVLSFTYFGSYTGVTVLIVTFIAAVLALIVSFRSNTWKRFALKKTIDSKVNQHITISLNINDEGVALSDLKPIGKAEFNNQTFEVTSLGGFVEVGEKIKVIDIKERKIIVEPIKK